jgi:hypothetical protein
MPAQPSVRVMKKEPDVYEVEVAAAQPTLHCITAGVGDVECLTGSKANAERLIEESFRFLLERESNTSILRSFRITDISRYFPQLRTRDSPPSRQMSINSDPCSLRSLSASRSSSLNLKADERFRSNSGKTPFHIEADGPKPCTNEPDSVKTPPNVS